MLHLSVCTHELVPFAFESSRRRRHAWEVDEFLHARVWFVESEQRGHSRRSHDPSSCVHPSVRGLPDERGWLCRVIVVWHGDKVGVLSEVFVCASAPVDVRYVCAMGRCLLLAVGTTTTTTSPTVVTTTPVLIFVIRHQLHVIESERNPQTKPRPKPQTNASPLPDNQMPFISCRLLFFRIIC